MIWARMLAYITGTVDQELLLRNEYLVAENRILRAQIKGRLLLSDAEKGTLAEIAHRLGRKALEELAAVAKPDTLLAWYRKLIASKFDGSKFRKSRGRSRVDEETERLVVRMAKENPGWGYDRIVGAMANLGLRLSLPKTSSGRSRLLPKSCHNVTYHVAGRNYNSPATGATGCIVPSASVTSNSVVESKERKRPVREKPLIHNPA
jgi:hypothetical protein